ncbi:MAG TPA: LysM peptidoglycan-binding domain-containing protein [Terriglobales bacterium]|jgi:membrane-bound lytic murein transglycosylase D|nr:LysM peptidoglycan-binding domain-containing protein [Terriglobales bacterium]
MRLRKSYLLSPLVVSLVLATISCETAEKKKAKDPPVQAMAPAPAKTPDPVPATKAEAPSRPLSSNPDAVAAIVKQVEQELQAAQANYAAGHLEAARAYFDKAVDLLLEGPLDIRSDERLQEEFDKVIDSVHTLEMAALKEGDGFTEQKSQPAPIDEANSITFPEQPTVTPEQEAAVKRIPSELPLDLKPAVENYISFFSGRGRGTLEAALVRSGRYRDMIQRVLNEEGVPQELIYLAQAESGFHPLAVSRAGARGMWQFMASRATSYGLERNWWVDERQDPEKATRAAARHLKDLYKQFNDWYLAMAAYNSGPVTVQNAVARTGYADFWELYNRGVLPKETRNYVPIILAVTIMTKNPAQYGLEHVQPESPLAADTVSIKYPVDLRLVAECTDASVDVIQDLNPSLLRMTTPKDDDFELRLPRGTKDKYQANIAAIPVDKRVWWRYYKVAPGDTLASIGRKYHTTASAISTANDLRAGDTLQPDSRLIIPIAPGKGLAADKVAFSKRILRYRVRKGDTVLSVADDFSVPAEKLRQWNHLHGNQLRPGRVLVIHRALAEPQAASARTSSARHGTMAAKSYTSNGLGRRVHKVKPGETLSSIAAEYNTTVAQLQRNNKLASATIHPGDTLIVSEIH